MRPITKRQNEVLEYIKRFIVENKYPPTIREISHEFQISVKGAYDHVKALEKKAAIRCDTNRSRAIEVIDREGEASRDTVVGVPLLGRVAAGQPLMTFEEYETSVPVPSDFLTQNKQYFAVRVSGDSMTGAGIIDGDIAIIAQQATANNGEIVVAMVDEAVTLKRFYKEPHRVQLRAENPDYPPIYTQDVRIVGKLAHVIRTYE